MMQTRWLSEFSCLSEYTRLYPTGVDRKYGQIQFAIGKIQTLYRLIAFVILRVRCRDISCYGALSCDASGKYGLILGKYIGAHECYFPNILHRSFCFLLNRGTTSIMAMKIWNPAFCYLIISFVFNLQSHSLI